MDEKKNDTVPLDLSEGKPVDLNEKSDDTSKSDEFERELTSIKKEKPEFKLNIDNKLKTMPDYYSNVKTKSRKKLTLFAKIMLAFIIVGISVMLSIAIIFTVQDVYGINKLDNKILIDVPEKSGVADIADILEENEVINSSFIFKAYYKLTGVTGNLNYGTFELNSNMSYDMIMDELAKYSASKNEVTVTFPEGLTIYEMAKKLEENGVCKAKEFIDVLNTKDFGLDFEKNIVKQELRFHTLEGYVFPDTYNFYKNDNPLNVAKKMLSNFQKKLTPEMIARMDELGYTLDEAITIASIVQKEAGKTSEMKMVASVYNNRLENRAVYPNLQACPTRDYANQLKLQMDIVDRKVIDAYNTYEDAGLPPGPICNPGLDAIEAMLFPEVTDYYFFCTNLKTGEFYYGKTLKEHEQNIKKAGLS